MKRLLVVDDNPIPLRTTSRKLQSAGHSVRAILRSTDVQFETASDYDAIIVDLEMPDMDGAKVIWHLLAGGYPAARIALHSDSPRAHAVAASLGVECVPKGTGDLLGWVRRVTEEKTK